MPSLEQKFLTVNPDSFCLSWSLRNFELFNIDFLRGKLIRLMRQRNMPLTASLRINNYLVDKHMLTFIIYYVNCL